MMSVVSVFMCDGMGIDYMRQMLRILIVFGSLWIVSFTDPDNRVWTKACFSSQNTLQFIRQRLSKNKPESAFVVVQLNLTTGRRRLFAECEIEKCLGPLLILASVIEIVWEGQMCFPANPHDPSCDSQGNVNVCSVCECAVRSVSWWNTWRSL